jgi:hypothetical protein
MTYKTERIKEKRELLKKMYSIDCKKQAFKSLPLDKERSHPYFKGFVLINEFKDQEQDYLNAVGYEVCMKTDGTASIEKLEQESFAPSIEWKWEIIPREIAERELILLNLNGET